MQLMSRLPSSQTLLRLIKLDLNALLVLLNETFKLVIRVEDLDTAASIVVCGLKEPQVVPVKHLIAEGVL
jgi:hypothetical protein